MRKAMYFPPFESVLRAVGLSANAYDSSVTISIPKGVFELILKFALENCEFDEHGYLKENPDIAGEISEDGPAGIRDHFLNVGYFGRRAGGTPAVDERWYLSTYPDVAEALQAGKISSAREHYNFIGFREGRSPNSNYAHAAILWKSACANKEVK